MLARDFIDYDFPYLQAVVPKLTPLSRQPGHPITGEESSLRDALGEIAGKNDFVGCSCRRFGKRCFNALHGMRTNCQKRFVRITSRKARRHSPMK